MNDRKIVQDSDRSSLKKVGSALDLNSYLMRRLMLGSRYRKSIAQVLLNVNMSVAESSLMTATIDIVLASGPVRTNIQLGR